MPPDVVQQVTVTAILLAVLTAGIAIGKGIFERLFKQMDAYFQFVREQSQRADDRQAGQLKAWIDAHREQIAVGAAQAEAWGRVQEILGEVLKALERLNGTKT